MSEFSGAHIITFDNRSDGRPPDIPALTNIPLSLERPGSSVPEESQQISKKGRNLDTTEPVSVDSAMEEISSMDHGNLNVVVDAAAQPGDLNKSSGASKPTFRDMVTGRGTSDRQKKALSELDVEEYNIQISGSRFTALQQVDDEIVSEGIGQDGSRSMGKAVAVEKVDMAKEIPFAPKTAESSWQGENRVEGELVSHSQDLEESLPMDLNMGVMRKSAEVASSEVVIPVKSMLD
ncbi:hypothetical protein V6N11_072343 [Hibiscus sabdariffa]|uniref:Uncharacterized protein n=1 Tax=Hibiscus sabdariffa TaxID=183260 RepID=A0ABR2U2T7_9ROSI